MAKPDLLTQEKTLRKSSNHFSEQVLQENCGIVENTHSAARQHTKSSKTKRKITYQAV